VVRALHVGPYERLGETYATSEDYIEGHHLHTVGPMVERYLDGPGSGVDPEAYRTLIDRPVEPIATASAV
jgi:AraC family transcriptional regulator